MSRRPGIGVDAMWDVASAILGLEENGLVEPDVPVVLREGAKLKPYGRLLRRKLRKFLGRREETPDEVVQEVWEKEMRPLLEAAKASSEKPSLSAQMALVNAGYGAQLSAREKLRRKKSL